MSGKLLITDPLLSRQSHLVERDVAGEVVGVRGPEVVVVVVVVVAGAAGLARTELVLTPLVFHTFEK